MTDASGASPIAVTIQFKPPASVAAGVYNDAVQISGCYDQACTRQVGNSPQTVQVQYTVTGGVIKLTSLAPGSAIASGPAFVLTVNGSGFLYDGSTVLWNGSPRQTTFRSTTQLSAQITAADIATAGTVPVFVSDTTNGSSNALSFTIQPATLSLDRVSPTSVTVGGPPHSC